MKFSRLGFTHHRNCREPNSGLPFGGFFDPRRYLPVAGGEIQNYQHLHKPTLSPFSWLMAVCNKN